MNVSIGAAPAGAPNGVTSALRVNYTSIKLGNAGTGCFRQRFAAPLNLAAHTSLEFTIFGDGSGALMDIELEDAAGEYFREYFVTLNFTGWKSIRPALPESRRLYAHAGGRFPQPGDSKMAMRSFSWSRALGFNLFLTNAKSALVFVGAISALPEQNATVGSGAVLTVGGSAVALPSQLTGSSTNPPSGDHVPTYTECEDVTKASSCRTFDTNGHQINNTAAIVAAVAREPTIGSELDLKYVAGARSTGRVRVTVFEWGTERLGPFGLQDMNV